VQLTEAKKEIKAQLAQVEEAENAIREYRAKMRKMDEDMQAYEERYNQNE
jgi:capsule polysaccharide export protein KpsE/RkpR